MHKRCSGQLFEVGEIEGEWDSVAVYRARMELLWVPYGQRSVQSLLLALGSSVQEVADNLSSFHSTRNAEGSVLCARPH